MLRPAGVDRHRLGVAEGAQTGQGQHAGQDQGADRVDVADRVEGEPPGSLGGVVAEGQGGHAVGQLVEDDRGHRHREHDEGGRAQGVTDGVERQATRPTTTSVWGWARRRIGHSNLLVGPTRRRQGRPEGASGGWRRWPRS